MIAFACGFLIAALIAGYPLYRKSVEAADNRVLADSVPGHLEDISALGGQVATWQQTAEKEAETRAHWEDRTRDERNARVLAEIEADRNATAIRGLLTNLARQAELRPDEPRGVADVVELRRGRRA